MTLFLTFKFKSSPKLSIDTAHSLAYRRMSQHHESNETPSSFDVHKNSPNSCYKCGLLLHRLSCVKSTTEQLEKLQIRHPKEKKH